MRRVVLLAACLTELSITALGAPKLRITTTSLPPATVGAAYSQALAATGGEPPYRWSTASGSLPGGLLLSAAGAISGTPSSAGTANFTVRVADNGSDSDTQPLALTVNAALQITTSSLPGGTVTVAYSQSLAASGGSGTYTWSIANGSLPPGLSLSGARIAGTPTTAGQYPFTVKATDGTTSAQQQLTITIASALAITTTSLPGGTVGAAYSQSLTATGGSGTYTWSIANGSLPPGLSLSGATIAGTPATSGQYSFTVKVTDGTTSAQRQLAITITSAVAIASASLPGGTVGAAYSQSLAATGGSGTYTWSIVNGSLPPGLSLSGATIAGTPTTAGQFSFTVKVTDGTTSAQQQFSITIASGVGITTTSLPGGTVGAPYTQSLAATGGSGRYTWSIASGSLPPGLTLSGATITGTPTTAGQYSFTVKVTDGVSSAQQQLSISIGAAIAIAGCPSASAVAGQAYSSSLSATGGTPPYSWSVSAGQLPPGLNLNPGSGAIAGVPAAAGAYNVTFQAKDSRSATATQACTINVGAALAITTASLAAGTVGIPYSQSLAATGGTPPYSWSIISGSLPAGVSLSGAQIAGTPSAAGAFAFSVRVTDSANSTADASLSITIGAGVSVATCPTSAAIAGQAYSSSATATGGQTPYSWSVATGQLPPGLSLAASSGTVSGTPTQAGNFFFTVRVADASSGAATKACAITVGSMLAITTGSLPSGATGGLYSQQLSASGGTPPYSWSIVSGNLPPGLSLNGASGQISGTATTAGAFNFTIRVSDSAGATANKDISITIAAGVGITSCPAPAATVGRPYGSQATATGGQPPYAWSIASGLLPGGLTLNASSGVVTGSPVPAGNADFVIKATDKNGGSATLSCTIMVRGALSIPIPGVPDALVNAAYSYTLSAIGGAAPYSWSISVGSLPPGLTLSSAGVLSGTPTAMGAFTFTVRVQDASGASTEKPMSMNVSGGLTIPACPSPVADAAAAYASDVSAIGGVAPYSWSISSGALPAGISLNASTGHFSGSPSQPGPYNFVLAVTDSAGKNTSRPCVITVASALAIGVSSLPDASLAAPYSQTIGVTGGVAPFVWSTSAGSLPPGLFLNSGTGQITGTPTVGGSFSFTIRVNDSAGAQVAQMLTLRVVTGLAITDCPLPVATAGQSYSGSAALQAGTAPFSWSISGGGLPPGLSLDAASGQISGTPSTTGVSSYAISVTDAAGASTLRACTLTVTGGALSVSTAASLAPAIMGSPYSASLNANGGAGPYLWSVVSGALPGGLTLDPAGQISGSATKTGMYQFTLKVADQTGANSTQAFTLNVLLAPAPFVSFTGLSDFVAPAQQPTFDLTFDSPYPATLTGVLTLSFTPDGSAGVDDPAIRLSNGSRTMNFTVPANSTKAVFGAPITALQTGTVAGTIELDVSLQANGADLGAVNGSRKLVRIDRLAPRLTGIQATSTASGIQLQIAGYSTTREITQGTFRFTPAGGGAPVEVTVPMTDAAAQWFGNSASWKFGGEFMLTQPFSIQGGRFSSVSVTLSNGQGSSDAITANF